MHLLFFYKFFCLLLRVRGFLETPILITETIIYLLSKTKKISIFLKNSRPQWRNEIPIKILQVHYLGFLQVYKVCIANLPKTVSFSCCSLGLRGRYFCYILGKMRAVWAEICSKITLDPILSISDGDNPCLLSLY